MSLNETHRHHSLWRLLLVLPLLTCRGDCPVVPERPLDRVYVVADATDPDLIGARVTVTADLVTIEYERDGVPVTVVYQVGDAT